MQIYLTDLPDSKHEKNVVREPHPSKQRVRIPDVSKMSIWRSGLAGNDFRPDQLKSARGSTTRV